MVVVRSTGRGIDEIKEELGCSRKGVREERDGDQVGIAERLLQICQVAT